MVRPHWCSRRRGRRPRRHRTERAGGRRTARHARALTSRCSSSRPAGCSSARETAPAAGRRRLRRRGGRVRSSRRARLPSTPRRGARTTGGRRSRCAPLSRARAPAPFLSCVYLVHTNPTTESFNLYSILHGEGHPPSKSPWKGGCESRMHSRTVTERQLPGALNSVEWEDG